MANLLDLPVEVFQMIIHEVGLAPTETSATRLRRPALGQFLKLRGVCRSFAAEIERVVFSQQPREFYSQNHDVQRIIENCFPRYMMQVSRKPGNMNKGIVSRLQRMAHYIEDQFDCEDEEQHSNIMTKTYDGLSKILDMFHVIHALWCDRVNEYCYCSGLLDPGFSIQGLPYQDRLCAAIAAGNHRLLSSILPRLTVADKDLLINTRPILFALKVRDLTSLDIILRHLETQSSSNRNSLIQPSNMFSLSDGISEALKSKNVPATCILLDYYKKTLTYPSRDIYNKWLFKASEDCSDDQLPSLRAVLSFKHGSKNVITRDIIAAVCARGNSVAIQEVLQQLGDVDKGTALTAPIFIAVRSGRETAIEACLQAGANVNLSVPSNIKAINNTHITPLDTAINRNDVDAADVLIKGGATIPHISQWPTHAPMYHLLHGAASTLTHVPLPHLDQRKALSKTYLEALRY
ncbi:hypothetical protein ACET3X_004564 [Alternaria dauci]|uniref:Ankyrin repeat protein n=1 Tax=Alternaria dauci TaxID=48095 RepID=A0ABR3UN96_9PLEO